MKGVRLCGDPGRYKEYIYEGLQLDLLRFLAHEYNRNQNVTNLHLPLLQPV